MSHTYTYMKLRKNFGRQPLFCQVAPYFLDTIAPDKAEHKNYILRNPVHEAIQVGPSQSQHIINTDNVKTKNNGANHAEGGWPKEVNYADEEATSRYRRRIERDDIYVASILNTMPKFEKLILQNNAVDMYEMYYREMNTQPPVETTSVILKNVYMDKSGRRPVSAIEWTVEDEPKLVVAHCSKRYPIANYSMNPIKNFFVWNLEDATDPLITLEPPTACWCLSVSPYDSSIILSGLEDGRVALFDIRAGRDPMHITSAHTANRYPVSSVVYMQSRLGTEFFCGSSDGHVLFWDTRNFMEPFEDMIMAVNYQGTKPDLSMAEPVSCLSYDKAFPARFLCGTDTGLVINANRRAKSFREQTSSYFFTHHGPVRRVQRSPISTKFFISCGDFSTHVWGDDIYSGPVITGSQQRYPTNDVNWAPLRLSSYMTVSTDGKFKIYDVLRSYKEPVITFMCSNYSLLVLKVHQEGAICAIGDDNGATLLLSFSESLVYSGPNDKTIMMQVIDREHHREHILENRIKEIRLKHLKHEEEMLREKTEDKPPDENEDENCKMAEDVYRKQVAADLRAMSGLPPEQRKSKL